jgi:predicted RNA-binding Zn-ribbon protein involved in translation (DUF1610 family)
MGSAHCAGPGRMLAPRSAGNNILWGAYWLPDMEATNMPLTGPIPEGHAFFCPNCGALYAVTHLRASKSESNIAKCVVCGKIMDQWDSTDVRLFKLIHRSEDA